MFALIAGLPVDAKKIVGPSTEEWYSTGLIYHTSAFHQIFCKNLRGCRSTQDHRFCGSTTPLFIYIHAGLPEWSNGPGLGPGGLVPTQVRVLCPAFFFEKYVSQSSKSAKTSFWDQRSFFAYGALCPASFL